VRPARVSIVTPFLDAGAFIDEAIESVLSQTFIDWELLLVDDGSSDGSTATARRYASAMPERIRYLSHPGGGNRGASASRNLAIRHATGEYLAFLDADDVYLPRKLEEQVRILDSRRDADVLYAATEYWHSWSGSIEDSSRDWIWHPHGLELDRVVPPPRALAAFLGDGGTVPCMGSVLVRREAVLAAGGWEDSFRTICTDQVFHAKLLLGSPALFVDVCWDRYRQHAGSSCRKVAAEGRTEATFAAYLHWLEDYLRAERVSDPSLWAALRAAMRAYDPLRASRATPAPAAGPALVSIVIPCHNQGRFLSEAIESATRQTHPALEIIVVDDGSTDDTSQIAGRFASVQRVRQANRGAPAARNAGLEKATGELVLFLDADDRLLPDAISRGVAALEAHSDWACVTGHVRVIDRSGTVVDTPPQDHAGGDQFVALLRSNYIWTPGAVLYRRSALDVVGAFDPAAGASADYELNLRLARRFAIGCHHHVVLEYRRHDANMSGDLVRMLRSAVSVRLAQRRFVTGNRAAEAAWREGLQIVRADFGERLLERVKHDARTRGRRRRALAGAMRLAQYYPAGLLRTLARAAGASAAP
jgi:glycosyltransferase involved in cell wall biosynthesis